MDNIAGTSGNDTINAIQANLNPFDKIDGGAGVDTLNIDDTATGALASFASVTLTGIEKINITSKLGLLNGALDVSSATAFGGLTDLTVNMTTPGAAQTVTAATTTALSISATAGAQNMTVVGGGKTASVTTTGAGTVQVGNAAAPTSADANAYTSVTAKTGSGTVKITDNSGTSGAIGSTLTSATVQSTSGVITLTGKGLTNVSLSGTSGAATITNATASHTQNVTLAGVTGALTDDTATTVNLTGAASTAAATTAFGTGATSFAAATALTVAGTKAIDLAAGGITATKLQTVTISGTGGAKLDVSGAGGATVSGYVTSVDASASSAVTSAANGTIGNDVTIGVSTTYAGGSGTDKLTVGASTKALTLGAGNDTLVLTDTTTGLGTGSTVNAGDGTDTLNVAYALAKLNTSALNTLAGKLTGFEKLEVQAFTEDGGTIELGYLASAGLNSYLKLNAITGAATTTTVNNIAAAGTVELAGDNGSGTNLILNVKDASFGSADTLNLVLTSDNAVRAGGNISAANTETINITTNNTNTTPTAQTDTLSLTAAAAKSIVVSGNAGLDMTGVNTATTVTSIDASGITGTGNVFKVTTGALAAAATIKGTAVGVNTIDATLATKAVTITVGGSANTSANVLKGGAAADTITGGAGDDTITSGGGLDTLTGGGGKDTFIIADGSGTATSRVVITDYVRTANAGSSDLLDFTGAAGASAIAATGWTVTNGMYTKAGASVADFYAALSVAGSTALKVAAFENSGNTYVLYTGAGTTTADDVFVELTGVTGLTSVSTTAGANALFIA